MKTLKRKLIKIGTTLAISLLLCIFTFHTGFSWLADTRIGKPNIAASVQGSYFESGDGSAQEPFEIKYPIQLYYFAWLQNLGAFNTAENGSISQYHFRVSSDLDMTGIDLPPIGTAKYPFVGSFDGEDHIIANLTMTSQPKYDIPDSTEQLKDYQVVGLFGVVGSIDDDRETVSNNTVKIGDNTYSYSSSTNQIKNFLIANSTFISDTPEDNKTLIGIVAGYVNGGNYSVTENQQQVTKYNQVISSVGVYNCKIQIGDSINILDSEKITDKLSSYSLVGYSKSAYDAYLAKEGSTGTSWGGSLDMEAIFDRLAAVSRYNTNRTVTYGQSVNTFYDEHGEKVGQIVQSVNTNGHFSVWDSDNSAGSFVFSPYDTNGMTDNFYYINGGIRTEVEGEYYYEDKQGYTIKDNDNIYYLSYNADFDTILHSTDEVVWFNEGNYYYFESYNISTNPIIKHYLDADNYGRVLLSDTGNTEWTRTNNSMYCSKNGTNNYLLHVNGANGGFGLSDNAHIYTFEGNNEYLNLDVSTLDIVSSNSNETEWLVTNGYVHTVINGNTYYLNANGTTGVTISQTPSTQWLINNNSMSTFINNVSYCLQNDNGWKLASASYYINCDGNYLQSNLLNTANIENANQWTIDANGYISCNGIYLRNNNGTLTTSNNKSNASTWNVEDDKIVNGIYRLQYNNGWKLQKEEYYISDGTNYLSCNGSIINRNSSNASTWTLSNGISEDGTISTVYENTTYYLRNNNGTLQVTTNAGSATTWTNDGQTISNGMYYLQYDSGWKLVVSGQKIYNGDHYLSYTDTDIESISDQSSANATYWNIDNGIISTIYNGTTHYLYNNKGSLTTTTDSSVATTWTIENGIYYDGEYFINYDGGWTLSQLSYYIYDETASRYVTGNGNNAQAGSDANINNASKWYLTSDNHLQNETYTGRYLKYYYRSRIFGSTTYPTYITNSEEYSYYYTYDSSNGRLSATNGSGRWATTYYLRYNNDWATSTSPADGDTFRLIIANGMKLSTISNSLKNLLFSPISFKNVTIVSTLDSIVSDYSLGVLINGSKTGKHMTFRTNGFQYSDSFFVDYDNINYSTNTTINGNRYYNTWATYFPINADAENGYQAIHSNTGYIIGGSYDDTTTGVIPYKYGDIRISQYTKSGTAGNNNETGFINNNVLTANNGTELNTSVVRTINASGDDVIKDSSYSQYALTKANFEGMLKSSSNKSNVYGLHFMNALISKENIVTAKHVLINGDPYDNYELPASSIDFNLKNKGYITFLAGTYFKGNNSFFSLHRIYRDKTTNKIEDIKEIKAIWGINNKNLVDSYKYIYEFEDEDGKIYYEYSDKTEHMNSIPTIGNNNAYERKFDTSWIGKQNRVSNGYIYYFEIPMDPGEYALGSVNGGTGAYLLYLDIAANAGDIEDEIVGYLQGVDFIADNSELDSAISDLGNSAHLGTVTSLLDEIGDNNPKVAIAIREIFSTSKIQELIYKREDIYIDNELKQIKFTVKGKSATINPEEFTRKYILVIEGVTVTVYTRQQANCLKCYINEIQFYIETKTSLK